jgi:hypothetical protein
VSKIKSISSTNVKKWTPLLEHTTYSGFLFDFDVIKTEYNDKDCSNNIAHFISGLNVSF